MRLYIENSHHKTTQIIKAGKEELELDIDSIGVFEENQSVRISPEQSKSIVLNAFHKSIQRK